MVEVSGPAPFTVVQPSRAHGVIPFNMFLRMCVGEVADRVPLQFVTVEYLLSACAYLSTTDPAAALHAAWAVYSHLLTAQVALNTTLFDLLLMTCVQANDSSRTPHECVAPLGSQCVSSSFGGTTSH